MNVEEAVKLWCDNNLTNSRSYRGSIPKGEFIAGWGVVSQGDLDKRDGELVYQDGTACSASHAFADIYNRKNRLANDTSKLYDVYMDCSSACYQGEGTSSTHPELHSFESLCEVLDFLVSYCGHDPQ